MALGIGSALKRGMKSAGRRLKEDPVGNILTMGQIDTTKAITKGGSKAVVGAVQDVFIPPVPELPGAKAVAPTPDDELTRKRKERAAQRKYAKAGRAGTMLTSDGGTLG